MSSNNVDLLYLVGGTRENWLWVKVTSSSRRRLGIRAPRGFLDSSSAAFKQRSVMFPCCLADIFIEGSAAYDEKGDSISELLPPHEIDVVER
jgi:hypothetical protein